MNYFPGLECLQFCPLIQQNLLNVKNIFVRVDIQFDQLSSKLENVWKHNTIWVDCVFTVGVHTV